MIALDERHGYRPEYMVRRRKTTLPFLLAWLGLSCAGFTQDEVDFTRDIQPILAGRCHSCHGAKLHLGELRLDRKSDAMRGGGSGVPAISPGRSGDSLLVRYVAGLDAKTVMPPVGPRLSTGQIQLLRNWIDQGAVWPDQEAASERREKAAAEHWAFLPRLRVTPPPVKNKAWVRNPLDAFVLSRLESRGWRPSGRRSHTSCFAGFTST
jgi:mono/diheme cytochrome c family protein